MAIQKPVIIIGASGHAMVCLEILWAMDRPILGFFDDDPNMNGLRFQDIPVLGDIDAALPHLQQETIETFIAIGNNEVRKKIFLRLQSKFSGPLINVIHPSAIISSTSSMGQGNFIAPGVIINTNTKVGSNVIINTGTTIDHDNEIHDFAQLCPGCNLAGNVIVEEGAFLGTGAVIIPGKTIGAFAIIGAGAVVTKDIPAYCTAVGVPAKVIKHGSMISGPN